MHGKPISNDQSTGTDLEQHGKHELPKPIEPFNPPEPCPEDVMSRKHREAMDAVRTELMCKCVLAALDNSTYTAMTVSAIARALCCSIPAVRAAVNQLVIEGKCIVAPNHPKFVRALQQ